MPATIGIIAGTPVAGLEETELQIFATGKAPDGSCTSSVDTTISGSHATLLRIYVKQKLFGVDYVLITGRTADGRTVDERVKP